MICRTHTTVIAKPTKNVQAGSGVNYPPRHCCAWSLRLVNPLDSKNTTSPRALIYVPWSLTDLMTRDVECGSL